MDITVIELSSDHSREYLALRQLSETDLPQYVGPSVERELIAGSDAIASILSAYPSEGTLILGAFTDNKLVGVISVSRKLSPQAINQQYRFILSMDLQPMVLKRKHSMR